MSDVTLGPAFFEEAVDRMGIAVGVYDESGHFRYVNDAYAELLGTDRQSLQGAAIWEVNPTFDADRFEGYWATIDPGETRRDVSHHERADGTRFPVEAHTTALEIDGERFHVGTIADITERRKEQRRLERQNERLERFASVVSHDLRNPLNVAIGRTDLVAEECDSDHIPFVVNALMRMNDLIDDVLTLAQQGRHLSETMPVGIESAARAAWTTAGAPTATLNVEGDLGQVESDRSRLCTLFENLFGNAIEHGGEDVTVTVGRLNDTVDDVEPDSAGLYVEDDGPGVPEDERERVFEHGYTTSGDGTGFGLAIVEEIAEAHGWLVSLTESDDGGARFEFHGVAFE